MVVKRLQIKGLYGVYNYDVKFHDDLTFLYGENGSGKTTILDILSSIITGQLYNLVIYPFKKIVLTFGEPNAHKKDEEQFIIDPVESADEPGNPQKFYQISFKSEPNVTETIFIDPNIERIVTLDLQDYRRYFVRQYELLGKLMSLFQYVYLPLSRNSQNGLGMSGFPANVRHGKSISSYGDESRASRNYLNESLRYAEELIRNGCTKIFASLTRLDADFKSGLFTSSLEVTNNYNLGKGLSAFTKEVDAIDVSSIEQSKRDYIDILQSIGEWNTTEEKRVNQFFKEYESALKRAKEEHKFSVEFFFRHMEFERIKKIASDAQKNEEAKSIERAPITDFVEAVNKFFSLGADKKRVSITDEGRLTVSATNPEHALPLHKLSSGEKQIIIIFAFLIFGLPKNPNGIYIIDEPEASLHLAWQHMFAESIRKVNPSVQLIFATHAPEIIASYTDKAVKLSKKANKSQSTAPDDEENSYDFDEL